MKMNLVILQIFLVCCLVNGSLSLFPYFLNRHLGNGDGIETLFEIPFSMHRSNLPRLPEKFFMNWTIYNVPAEVSWPPYPDDNIAPPYCAGRASTYYDWNEKAMLEVYHGFCVPIFKNGSDWRCHFLNADGVAYLISLDKTSPYPPCCVFAKPWNPPSPDFVKALSYNKTTVYESKTVDWYVLNDYGYGWYRERLPGGERTPGFFWYRATKGWGSQTFYDVTEGEPPAGIFDVPSECKNAKSCGYPIGF